MAIERSSRFFLIQVRILVKLIIWSQLKKKNMANGVILIKMAIGLFPLVITKRMNFIMDMHRYELANWMMRMGYGVLLIKKEAGLSYQRTRAKKPFLTGQTMAFGYLMRRTNLMKSITLASWSFIPEKSFQELTTSCFIKKSLVFPSYAIQS